MATAPFNGGNVEPCERRRSRNQVEVPPGVAFSDYALARLSHSEQRSRHGPGRVTDDLTSASHRIEATSLPGLTQDLPLRVGVASSGTAMTPDRPLWIVQEGGAPVTTITLSGVVQPRLKLEPGQSAPGVYR